MTGRDPGVVEAAGERWLRALGARLRDTRLTLRVSVTAAAEAAGVSRVTWHRMEAGSASVSAGAYARALDALGIVEDHPFGQPEGRPAGAIPVRIRVGDWPELSALAWSMRPDTLLTPLEALSLYERNGRHLDEATISADERALIDDLRLGLADGVQA